MAGGVSETPGEGCSRLTFTHGFLLGQGTMIVLAFLFLRYVVFEQERKEGRPVARNIKRKRRRFSTTSHFSAKAGVASSDWHLLQKLGYDIQSHPPEPCDWLNVIVAQAFTGYREMIMMGDTEGKGAHDFVEKMLNTQLAAEEQSAFVRLEHIAVTEVDFGDDFPTIKNARVRPSEEPGRVRVELDVEYTDHAKIGIDTCVIVNFPRPRFAILPVSLGLTLVKFSATLMIEIPPTATPSPPVLHVSLQPDFHLDVSATSLIGSRAKLQDIPKVEQLVVGRIRAFVNNKFVPPRSFPIKLPNLSHPRADEMEYEFVSEDVPEDVGVAQQHSPTPDADEDETREPDMDDVVRSPTPSPRLLAASTALQSRLQPPQQSNTNVFRHRNVDSLSSGDAMPGHLPRKMATPSPPPIRGVSPHWRPNDQIMRGTIY